MSHARKNEEKRRHFRSDRLVVVNGSWFIATREGVDVGPFPSRRRAEAASDELRQVLARIDDPKYASKFVREYESHVQQTGRTPIVVSSGSKATAKSGLAYRIQSPGTAGITRVPLQVRRWLGE